MIHWPQWNYHAFTTTKRRLRSSLHKMTNMAELSSHLRQLSLIRSKFNERRESEQMSVWDTDESPRWRWCIWSFRIHAAPPCLTWLIRRDGARLLVLGLSPPAWRLQSPERSSRPRLHLCWLLIEVIFGQVYHSFFSFFFISFGGRRSTFTLQRAVAIATRSEQASHSGVEG